MSQGTIAMNARGHQFSGAKITLLRISEASKSRRTVR
jgi:hypothetical protein